MKYKKNRMHKKNRTSDEEICSEEDDYNDDEDDSSKPSSNDSTMIDKSKNEEKLINKNLLPKLEDSSKQKLEDMKINLYPSESVSQNTKYYNSNNFFDNSSNKFQYTNVPTNLNHQLANENIPIYNNNNNNEHKQMNNLQTSTLINTKLKVRIVIPFKT